MRRGLIDRFTDTAPFRFLLVIAGIVLMPWLVLGLFLVPVALTANEPSAWGAALLVVGGVAGVVGWVRASSAMRDPERHNARVTLVCLWIGVATALALSGGILVGVVLAAETGWSLQLLPAACFAAAPLVWAVGGIGSVVRLRSRRAEIRGSRSAELSREPIDLVPAVMLLVAVSLALAAGVFTATL